MRKIILIVSFLVVFALGTCSTIAVNAWGNDKQTAPIKVWAQNENGGYSTLVVVDDNTGVNYIVVSGVISSEGISVAMTPRLNADGTLYTSK